MKGFTLIELFVVLGLLAIVSFFGIGGLLGYRESQNLELTTNEIVFLSRDIQNRSITQESGTAWGIRFLNINGDNTYEIFRGLNYSSSGVDKVYSLKRGTKFSAPGLGFYLDQVFNPVTGKSAFSKIVSLVVGRNNGFVGDIIFRKEGLITTRQENGLVGYWHLDENTSTIARDSSGFSNNLILEDGPTWQSFSNCKAGWCINFDGVNDYAVNNSVSNLNFSDTNEITIMAWINLIPNNLDFWLSMNILGGTNKYRFGSDSNGNPYWNMSREVSGSYNGFTFSPGVWYQVVLTAKKDPINIVTKLYVDGDFKTSVDEGIDSLLDPIDLMIGTGEGPAIDPFNGSIDEVRVYNRVLEEAEIITLYNDFK